MGIITRQLDGQFVIASDRSTGDARTNRPPKGKPSDTFEVWSGDAWSTEMSIAKKFETMDDADEYVRAHYQKVTAQT